MAIALEFHFTIFPAKFNTVESINSTPMAITMKPIILDNEFIPDAPSTFVIFREMLSKINVQSVTANTEAKTMSLSVTTEYIWL